MRRSAVLAALRIQAVSCSRNGSSLLFASVHAASPGEAEAREARRMRTTPPRDVPSRLPETTVVKPRLNFLAAQQAILAGQDSTYRLPSVLWLVTLRMESFLSHLKPCGALATQHPFDSEAETQQPPPVHLTVDAPLDPREPLAQGRQFLSACERSRCTASHACYLSRGRPRQGPRSGQQPPQQTRGLGAEFDRGSPNTICHILDSLSTERSLLLERLRTQPLPYCESCRSCDQGLD